MKKVKITQIKSGIGRLPNQRATLQALGLNKISRTVEKPDNDAIRGMIRTIRHLVRVED